MRTVLEISGYWFHIYTRYVKLAAVFDVYVLLLNSRIITPYAAPHVPVLINFMFYTHIKKINVVLYLNKKELQFFNEIKILCVCWKIEESKLCLKLKFGINKKRRLWFPHRFNGSWDSGLIFKRPSVNFKFNIPGTESFFWSWQLLTWKVKSLHLWNENVN
jgi:hypothetical protein